MIVQSPSSLYNDCTVTDCLTPFRLGITVRGVLLPLTLRWCVWQATEHLVQFAMQTRKPFATVPCCVFPNDFPGRRLNGAPVRKYDDFISYLVSLAPEHIQVEELMFEGRNKVVYCTSWESDPRPAAACAH